MPWSMLAASHTCFTSHSVVTANNRLNAHTKLSPAARTVKSRLLGRALGERNAARWVAAPQLTAGQATCRYQQSIDRA